MTIDYEGRELDVDYVYLPGEERTSEHPGCDEDVDVSGLVYEGENIIDLYDDDEMNVIMTLVLESHIDSESNAKLERML